MSTPFIETDTMRTKIASFLSAGSSMLERCLDAVLMFRNRVDALFGWPENLKRRSEQYWRRVELYDDGCVDDEIVVWNTVMKKLKAPGKNGNLYIHISPRTPFVQDDMAVDSYEIQRRLNPDSGPAPCSPQYQTRLDTHRENASTTIGKPKGPGKLGMLRIIVPATVSFVEGARRANEYYKQKKVTDRVLRQAVKCRLPPLTPSEIETLLSPIDSLYLDCNRDDELLSSSHCSSEARLSDSFMMNSIPCSRGDQEAQANNVWLDLYSQEASQRKVSNYQADTTSNPHRFAPHIEPKVVYWASDLSAMPSGFWDQI